MSTAPLQTCPVCEQQVEPQVVLQNRSERTFILRCPSCQLSYASPQPDEATISAYYNGMYSDLAVEYSEQKMQWARDSVRGYLKTLKQHGLTDLKTVVDLGGGLGYYAKAFEEAGLATTLVEPDPVSAAFAREKLGLMSIAEVSIETFERTSTQTFDIVFLRHVIEHYADPNALMRSVDSVLKENGVLIIETDNNAGVELLLRPRTARFYLDLYQTHYDNVSYLSLARHRPFAVDPPRHLFAYRLSNLSHLLRKKGIIPLVQRSYRLGHPIYWPNMPPTRFSDLISAIARGSIRNLVIGTVDLFAFPIRVILERMGLGAGICIYAVKNKARA
jgi:SAM-dependent methyltransferase